MNLAIGCVAENTPKYLGQALRLVQSVRWFGNTLNKADLYVCIVDDIDPDYQKELENYGVNIRIVPRFSTRHPPSNKLRFLELPDLAQHDQILLLDCDTIVVRDPAPNLFCTDFAAKIADVPTVPLDTFYRLFAAFGLGMPEASQHCTVRGEPTIPYFNAGVLAFSRRAMDTLVPKWIDLNQQLINRLEILGEHNNFCEQASLSLALTATGTPFEAVSNAFNFPMHFDEPASAPGLANVDPFIIHYHWLTDPSGYVLPSTYPAVNQRIAEFNTRLRKERESAFNNHLFWNQRYTENPELGSGIGSRGEVRDYKRHLLEEVVSRWAPQSIMDVGCGDMEVGSALPAAGYTGLDLSEVIVAANRKKHPDRIFLAGNFLEIETAPADMLVCLDVLIHLASPDNYRKFVHKLVRTARKVGIVAGDETDPGLGSIVFYHEPLSRTLVKAGATNIRKIGTYRHISIYEFTPPIPEHRHALIVLGMHRSGTSALAGTLSLLGIDPGPSLMPAHGGINPKGFWEHADIVAVHERLLAALHTSWHDERPLPDRWWKSPTIAPFREELIDIINRDFSRSPAWILKDPRLCRLLPLWLEILAAFGAEPRFALCLRNPAEVAQSLAQRDGIPESRALLLWLRHLLEAVVWTQGYPRTIVNYEQLLADWRSVAIPLLHNLSLPVPTDTTLFAKVDDFLEPSLRHHRAEVSPISDNHILQLAIQVFDIARSTPVEQLPAALATVADEVNTVGHLIAPWAAQIQSMTAATQAMAATTHTLNESIIHLENRITSLNTEIARIKSTVSWQVTKPLRLIANLPRLIREHFSLHK